MHSASRLLTICLTVLLLFAAAASFAADPTPVDTEIRSLSLFKNGHGLFIRSGALPASGSFTMGPVPAASHGTYWLSYDAGTQLLNVSSGETPSPQTRPAATVLDMLSANVGRRVVIHFSGEGRDPVSGTLLSVPEPPEPEPLNPYLSIIEPPYRPPSQPSLALVETAEGVVAFHPAQVAQVDFEEMPITEISEEEKWISLEGEVQSSSSRPELTVSYLAKGITWVPSYLFDISAPEVGSLVAKAEIINEIEDLEGVDIDLVTGFPSFEFVNIISPLAKKEDLAGFMNAVGRGSSAGREAGRYARESIMTQMAYAPAAMGPVSATPTYGDASAGVAAEDLFYYPLHNVTLERGRVGYFGLFSAEVPYEHIYTWDIPDYVDQNEYYRAEEEPQPEIVWHNLELENTMNLPWTTAPFEVMQEERVVAQGTLKYTAKGADTRVRISKALDLVAEEQEREINRQHNAANFYGYSYDRVTLRGELSLTNHKDEAVAVEITKTVTGEVSETMPQAQVEKLARGLRKVNPRSQLTWEVELAPGEKLELSYAYAVYVRR
jgi:hypothetical protein